MFNKQKLNFIRFEQGSNEEQIKAYYGKTSFIEKQIIFKFYLKHEFTDDNVLENDGKIKFQKYNQLIDMLQYMQNYYDLLLLDSAPDFDNNLLQKFTSTMLELKDLCKNCKDATTKSLITQDLNGIDSLFKYNYKLLQEELKQMAEAAEKRQSLTI